MTLEVRPFEIDSDGLLLRGGALAPADARATVVLLHGIPSSAPPEPGDTGYEGFARLFVERGYAALWADMRAVRASEGYFSIEGWVRDATRIVEEGIALAPDRPVALIGSSAGGCVGAETVARGAPVQALGLLAAPAVWISFESEAAAALERITVEAGMAVDPVVTADPSDWVAEFEKITTARALAHVQLPTLIVHGTADDVVPVEHAALLRDAAPDARVEILEGAGHQLRRDDRAVKLVLDWLDDTL
jgi:alpha-beta hydrolase superfamily lysophospholipase